MAETETAPLLVELLVEELPPKALKALGAAFADGIANGLIRAQLKAREPGWTSYATPRRLAVLIPEVLHRAADRTEEIKLMPASVGLNAAGEATPALLKKLAAVGADASVVPRLKRRVDGKSEVLFLDSVVAGLSVSEGLQLALDETLARLPIPKVMQYQLADGWSSVSFVRPAHGLVALHGDALVAVRALGLDSGRSTLGHRFEARVSPIVLISALSYEAQLREEGAVIASFATRRAEIERQLAATAEMEGRRPIADDALLDEVTGLVEWPNVLACEFEHEFLAVPAECLVLTMKANQKYFPLLDAQGALSNRFLVVSNIRPSDPSRVVEGNERVVRPRLADAKFFFDQDRKRSLESRIGELGRVTYFERLGTMDNRVQRVRAIAAEIGQMLGGRALAGRADAAARLSKADLLTNMVGEFPELQGVMGRYYAIAEGLDPTLAQAISDQYKPRFSGDTLPCEELGLVLAIADKLETLVGMFAIGRVPTGDRDPLALRRQALGIVRMLVEKSLPFRVDELLEISRKPFANEMTSGEAMKVFAADQALRGNHSSARLSAGVLVDDDALALLAAFIQERLVGYLKDQGYGHREIEAVMAIQPLRADEIIPRLEAVRAFVGLAEAESLAAANKRVANILKKASDPYEPSIGDAVLVEPAERELAAEIRRLSPRARAAFDRRDYVEALKTWAEIGGTVDAFFETVRVNVDEVALRVCRLSLLSLLHAEMNRVADLSKLAA
jgi:glycyl-tRNA synthetase beta chain